jgi:hypothetical protein
MLTSDPSFSDVLAALEAFEAPLAVTGTASAPDLRIELPSGEASPTVGPELAQWIETRAEPAPFGDGEATRLDPAVRHARRLPDRANLRVTGFDAAAILSQIEPVLSPDARLEARLTDVVIYGEGGHFQAHRDTPRAQDMVGTLVVRLPIPHRGGALRLRCGGETMVVFDAPPATDSLAWAAFHGDVDHEVLPVRQGACVSLTYALHRSGDLACLLVPNHGLVEAVRRLLGDRSFLPEGGQWLLPCARRVIRAKGEALGLEQLVGRDREVAAALRSLELPVAVRSCVAVVPSDGDERASQAPLDWAEVAIRLERADLPPLAEAVTLVPRAHDDDGSRPDVQSLDGLIAHDDHVRCTIRRSAHTTLVDEAQFSPSGYFGNDHFDAWFYAFAALEVTVPDLRARALVVDPPAIRYHHAKFGDATLVAEHEGERGRVLELRFADGSVRKFLEGFVERLP